MTDRQTLLSTPSAGKTFHINSALPGSDMVSGTDGNDTVYAKASGRVVDQIHIYAGGGDDTMHLNLAVIGLSTIQHGHHVFGGKGADMFRFCNLDVTRGTLVGRIDDLTAEDSIYINDQRLDLARPQDIRGFTVQVVLYQGQQWLEMRNVAGGRALYNLEGARQERRADGTWSDEEHFMAWDHPLPEVLPVVRYEDPVNFIPAQLKAAFNADRDLSYDGDLAASVTRVGSSLDDLIVTRRGDDLISGEAGNDSLDGFMGADTIYGGTGHDLIEGGKGHDRLAGNDGADIIAGGSDNDTLLGGNGKDILFGGSEHDLLIGDAGNDVLRAGTGTDTLRGGQGADILFGDGGDDLILGDDGTDGGNDILLGGQGNDTLRSGAGDDTLIGGGNRDVLWGGTGPDTFVFHAHDGQDDVIGDFSRHDSIDLSAIDLRLVNGFTGHGREVILQEAGYGARILADVDGDRVADFRLTIIGDMGYDRANYLNALIL